MVGTIIIQSVAISAVYALIAIGFTIIFGVGGVLNFAHGAFLTTGAFTAFVVSNKMGLSPWVGILAGGVVGGLLGLVLYVSVVNKIKESFVTTIIVTLVLGLTFEHLYRIFIHNRSISVAQPVDGSFTLLNAEIQMFQLFIFVTSWLIIGMVFYFVNYTKQGKALLATSMSQRGAGLAGIDITRINLYTWAIAASLAGIAGVLIMMVETGSWNMGIDYLVLSFAIVILGGIGSIRGSVIGAHVIGFTETITVLSIDARLQGMASLIVLVLILLVKPEGLFGREVNTS